MGDLIGSGIRARSNGGTEGPQALMADRRDIRKFLETGTLVLNRRKGKSPYKIGQVVEFIPETQGEKYVVGTIADVQTAKRPGWFTLTFVRCKPRKS
jgi:hypothetical protein